MNPKKLGSQRTAQSYMNEFVDRSRLEESRGIELYVCSIDCTGGHCPLCDYCFVTYHNCEKGLMLYENGMQLYFEDIKLVRTNTSWVLVCREHGNCTHVKQRAYALKFGQRKKICYALMRM